MGNWIEPAKTSRSKCVTCDKTIIEGTARLSEETRDIGIPTLIHESNGKPGVANRFLSRFATRTAVGLAAANTHLRKPGTVTGTPVRREFFEVPPFDPAATTRRLLVFGGSQGSRVINRVVARATVLLEKSHLEVIHQTGEKDLTGTRQRYPRMPANWSSGTSKTCRTASTTCRPASTL